MKNNPFRQFKTSPEIIKLAAMMYISFLLSLRNVGDVLHARGIDVCYESVRLWVDRFGTVFAGQICKRWLMHASLYNHFNGDKHLSSRSIFKAYRSEALSQWRQLAQAAG